MRILVRLYGDGITWSGAELNLIFTQRTMGETAGGCGKQDEWVPLEVR